MMNAKHSAYKTPWPNLGLRVSFALCTLALLCGFKLPLLETQTCKVTFNAPEAERLAYDAPLLGTLDVVTAESQEVFLPELRDRFVGFDWVEDFEAGRVEADGSARSRWRFRLTPAGHGPWQLRPFVVTLKDKRTGAEVQQLTRAAIFPAPLPLPEANGAPECDPRPAWIAPGWRTLGLWTLYALIACGLVALLIPLFRRTRRVLKERSLSPEARAEVELARLLAEGLLAQGKIKRFTFGLTGVVRRYFERACSLRATRQTTQEFLEALTADARFDESERNALFTFLAAADRVKFSGQAASLEEAEASVSAARSLIAEHAAKHAEDKNESLAQ